MVTVVAMNQFATTPEGPTTLIVRSGGGMPGLDIHAGITIALARHGIEATHCIGTSAGAIISAMDSSGYNAIQINKIIAGLTDHDVRDERILGRYRPWITHYLGNAKIIALAESLFPEQFVELKKPLGVHVVRNSDGEGITFGALHVRDPEIAKHPNTKFMRDAVLASMSIHGIFPDVLIDGVAYSDGGTSANVPVPHNWRNFDRVVLAIASPPTSYPEAKNVISRLLRNVQWLMRNQIHGMVNQVQLDERVIVVWPKCGAESNTLRFDHRLIDAAKREAYASIAAQLKK